MKTHPFIVGDSYPVDDILKFLWKELESGRIKDVKAKAAVLELFEKHRGERAVFSPHGPKWGSSAFNPNAWERPGGGELIVGFRQQRERRRYSANTKEKVLMKTDGHCYSCGQKLAGFPFDICHIIPFSVGGSDEIENLLPGCRVCNRIRQNFTPHQIQRILSIGSVLVREVDRETRLGNDVFAFLETEDARRRMNRKYKDFSLLVYQRSLQSRQPNNVKTATVATEAAETRLA